MRLERTAAGGRVRSERPGGRNCVRLDGPGEACDIGGVREDMVCLEGVGEDRCVWWSLGERVSLGVCSLWWVRSRTPRPASDVCQSWPF